MDCLLNYIGIPGCNQDEPDSAMYITDLPGIPLKTFDSLTDAERSSYVSVFRKIEKRAVLRFENAVISNLSKRFKLKRIVTTVNDKRLIDDVNNQTAANASYQGVLINYSESPDNYISPLATYYINTVSVYIKTVPVTDLVITVFNYHTNAILATKTIVAADIVAGWNTVTINQTFNAAALFVAYDATDIDAVYQKLNTCEIDGGKSDDLSSTFVVDKVNNSFGLTLKFSVQCSFDRLICENINLFKLPLLYCIGIETMLERLQSDRFNWFTINDEKAQKNLEQFTFDFNQTLDNALSGIDLNTCDDCLECVAPYQVIDSMP